MPAKYYKSSFALLMAGTFLLSPVTALGSSAVAPASQAEKRVQLTVGQAQGFECPAALAWADLSTILANGKDYGGHHYTTINPQEFQKNLPAGYNVLTKRYAQPDLLESYFIETNEHKVERRCIYGYHTLASGVTSMVKANEGYKLGIKTDTGMKVTTLQIHNDGTHDITVNVFPADQQGKYLASETRKTFTVKPKDVDNNAQFIQAPEHKYFTVQVTYKGGLGVVECPYQMTGGKFNLTFTEKTLGNTCALVKENK
jgi:hypothetical protein